MRCWGLRGVPGRALARVFEALSLVIARLGRHTFAICIDICSILHALSHSVASYTLTPQSYILERKNGIENAPVPPVSCPGGFRFW